jgi:hypothetical protein
MADKYDLHYRTISDPPRKAMEMARQIVEYSSGRLTADDLRPLAWIIHEAMLPPRHGRDPLFNV